MSKSKGSEQIKRVGSLMAYKVYDNVWKRGRFPGRLPLAPALKQRLNTCHHHRRPGRPRAFWISAANVGVHGEVTRLRERSARLWIDQIGSKQDRSSASPGRLKVSSSLACCVSAYAFTYSNAPNKASWVSPSSRDPHRHLDLDEDVRRVERLDSDRRDAGHAVTF